MAPGAGHVSPVNGAKAIADVLDGFFAAAHSQKELNKLGLLAVRIIKTRTRSWRDVEGRRFQDYSPKYKEKRIAARLAVTPMGKNTDSMLVWNSIDGMMQQIEDIVSNDLKSVVIDITSPVKKKLAYWHSEAGVGKKGKNIRKFWGLSSEEMKYICEIFRDDMNAELGDLVKMAQLKLGT